MMDDEGVITLELMCVYILLNLSFKVFESKSGFIYLKNLGSRATFPVI